MAWVMGHGGKMKGIRDCSLFRGGGGPDGIYGLSFPEYNAPPPPPCLPYNFYPVPLPSNSLYFWDDPVYLKFHLFF